MTSAQNLEMSADQPVIQGSINDMEVILQGDVVAFFAAKKRSPLLESEQCGSDLNCTMQKNKTEAVVLNPEGILLLYTAQKLNPDNIIGSEPLYPASTTDIDGFDSTAIKPTLTHISLEFPQPTATLNTGNEVIDETPGILLTSNSTRECLAEIVTLVSNSRKETLTDSDETLAPVFIEPSSTQYRNILTTLTEDDDELMQMLTSSSMMLMPSPTQIENWLLGDGSVRLELGAEILTIKPSPSGQYGSSSETTSSFSYTVKQAPTTNGGDRSTAKHEESTVVTTSSTTNAAAQETNLPLAFLGGSTMTFASASDTQLASGTDRPESAPPSVPRIKFNPTVDPSEIVSVFERRKNYLFLTEKDDPLEYGFSLPLFPEEKQRPILRFSADEKRQLVRDYLKSNYAESRYCIRDHYNWGKVALVTGVCPIKGKKLSEGEITSMRTPHTLKLGRLLPVKPPVTNPLTDQRVLEWFKTCDRKKYRTLLWPGETIPVSDQRVHELFDDSEMSKKFYFFWKYLPEERADIIRRYADAFPKRVRQDLLDSIETVIFDPHHAHDVQMDEWLQQLQEKEQTP